VKTPELVTDPAEWQARCLADRDAGRRIALVPTMGYLHDGHRSLLKEARRRAGEGGRAVASIFVNPTQFGPGEDLSRYPRDLEGDLATCAAAGIDLIFAPPNPALMFPPGHETWVDVERVSQGLCGASRPGHFRGVATVVAKLFNLTRPHLALFGEKDWQQLAVVRAMVRDLAFGIEVVGMPIVREEDGLALSSRNAYLSAAERKVAVRLNEILRDALDRLRRGEPVEATEAHAVSDLQAAGFDRIDYVETRTPDTLARLGPGPAKGPIRLLAAAHIGRTRLIDNMGD
jgi:pantoate--beta-alanine ligase